MDKTVSLNRTTLERQKYENKYRGNVVLVNYKIYVIFKIKLQGNTFYVGFYCFNLFDNDKKI